RGGPAAVEPRVSGGAARWGRRAAVQAGTGGRAAARAGGGDKGKCRQPDGPPEASAAADALGRLLVRHDLPGCVHVALLRDGGPTRPLPASTLRRGGRPRIGRCPDPVSPRTPRSRRRPSYGRRRRAEQLSAGTR